VPGSKLVLNAKLKDTVWIRITADNAVVFEGTLAAGSEKEWTAQDRFAVVVGYAPGVSMTLNGKPVDVLKGAKQDINQFNLTWNDAAARG
jgi:hypothetical protein